MLTLTQIKDSITEVVNKYPVKKLSIFGSYADGSATEGSDLDMLIEFSSTEVSLFLLSEIKDEIQSKLNREIDLIHAPIDEGALIKIDRVVDIYEQ